MFYSFIILPFFTSVLFKVAVWNKVLGTANFENCKQHNDNI